MVKILGNGGCQSEGHGQSHGIKVVVTVMVKVTLNVKTRLHGKQ